MGASSQIGAQNPHVGRGQWSSRCAAGGPTNFQMRLPGQRKAELCPFALLGGAAAGEGLPMPGPGLGARPRARRARRARGASFSNFSATAVAVMLPCKSLYFVPSVVGPRLYYYNTHPVHVTCSEAISYRVPESEKKKRKTLQRAADAHAACSTFITNPSLN